MEPAPPPGFQPHDHSICTKRVLEQAMDRVAESGARLTPVRRRTLEILLEAHRAMGAYEVLERLSAEGFGNQPPVAYRALEFLVAQGLAHRVQRLNAFAACLSPAEAHTPTFLICRSCDHIAEAHTPQIHNALQETAKQNGFQVERATIEALGLCPACAGSGAS